MSSYSSTLKNLGLIDIKKGDLSSYSPIDGALIGKVKMHQVKDVDAFARKAKSAFLSWREIPAPLRGELIRLLAEVFREHKEDLGKLVSLENGKIYSEGLGEVQEMIDIFDFAVGLSRQLYGLTIASERPGHHMREMWQPLGPIGVITAFNFPVAVWSWNAAIALVCGNSIVWKPSEKTPLSTLACANLFEKAIKKYKAAGHKAPANLMQVLMGEREVGQALVDHHAFPMISATGSTAMGQKVGQRVAKRFGKSLLELGGNNAMVVCPSADLDMAVRAILFGAVGTCGQRCTTLRRLIVHESIADALTQSLVKAYAQIKIGDPLDKATLVGPLIDQQAYKAMQDSLKNAKKEKGEILYGGGRIKLKNYEKGYYVEPALIDMPKQSKTVCEETFAPILYIIRYKKLEDAIALNNSVPQGLSSCVFTNDVKESERFLSATGSDCGIANVNIGTSGAEIGGAFGGEKETGGGRESGSDAWKAYMRRQTQTINYSTEMPLAQGVVFEV